MPQDKHVEDAEILGDKLRDLDSGEKIAPSLDEIVEGLAPDFSTIYDTKYIEGNSSTGYFVVVSHSDERVMMGDHSAEEEFGPLRYKDASILFRKFNAKKSINLLGSDRKAPRPSSFDHHTENTTFISFERYKEMKKDYSAYDKISGDFMSNEAPNPMDKVPKSAPSDKVARVGRPKRMNEAPKEGKDMKKQKEAYYSGVGNSGMFNMDSQESHDSMVFSPDGVDTLGAGGVNPNQGGYDFADGVQGLPNNSQPEMPQFDAQMIVGVVEAGRKKGLSSQQIVEALRALGAKL